MKLDIAAIRNRLSLLKNDQVYAVQKLTEHCDSFLALENPTALDALKAEAYVLYYAGKYAESQPLFDAVAAIAPSVEIECTRSQIFFRLSRPKDAETAARKALQLLPESSWGLVNLASALLAQERFQDAKQALTDCLAIDANNPRALQLAIYTSVRLGENPEAMSTKLLALSGTKIPKTLLQQAVATSRKVDGLTTISVIEMLR